MLWCAADSRVDSGGRKAFTLVELLVVIGIIALLIAILMPALSRARKQALQASCGSNVRQVTYAALSYANDWKEQLPPLLSSGQATWYGGSYPAGFLSFVARLPIIGFDSTTIWDLQTYWASYFASHWLGGFGYVMRDYLKNDFDVYVCPDGWYTKANMVTRWSGVTSVMGPGNYGSGAGDTWWEFTNALISYRSGYLWLPHRHNNVQFAATPCAGGPIRVTDTPGSVAKTASDIPDLLVAADFNYFAGHYYAGCGQPSAFPGPSKCGVAANHNASSYKQLAGWDSACMPQVFPPNIGRQENPMSMPLGQNRSRIDARTTWLPWQDWSYYRWSPVYYEPSYSRVQWCSF